jgi:hypothetical protein
MAASKPVLFCKAKVATNLNERKNDVLFSEKVSTNTIINIHQQLGNGHERYLDVPFGFSQHSQSELYRWTCSLLLHRCTRNNSWERAFQKFNSSKSANVVSSLLLSTAAWSNIGNVVTDRTFRSGRRTLLPTQFPNGRIAKNHFTNSKMIQK